MHRARLHLLYLQGMQVRRDEVLRLDAVSDGLVGHSASIALPEAAASLAAY